MIKTFTITKKLSKHGSQVVLVVPSFLSDKLKAKSIVEARLTIIGEENE